MRSQLRSVDEAAKILGISPWTVRFYLRIGKLARVKVGRRTLIEEAEIEHFIERCKQAAERTQPAL